MRVAVYPGSFDPVTSGHLDVIRRAAGAFDQLIVGVLRNPRKASLLTIERRQDVLRAAVAEAGLDAERVTVEAFEGLTVDFCHARGAAFIVRGLRAVTDFDYEFQMAQANYKLAEVETFFVSTSPAYGYLSSSLVKEIARHGGDISGWVPPLVESAIRARVGEGHSS